jgi:transaldolase
MNHRSYLHWLVSETPTTWWNDSGDPEELAFSLEHGASGVTTNPVLTYQAISARPAYWRPLVGDLAGLSPAERAEKMMNAVVRHAAAKIEPQYRSTAGAEGYVCAQVNPNKPGDRETMLAMAHRYATWAPNIAVKLPVTAAGLDVLEECIAEGITVTATVSFTVPQVVMAAERHRRGAQRARAAGITPGHCFAVIMIGRLDDYLRDIAQDCQSAITESDILKAGLAVSKRACQIFRQEGYEAKLLIAGFRGAYQIFEMAGADAILSIHPRYQPAVLKPGVPREPLADVPVPADALARLLTLPEFVRSFEPDGMPPADFIRFGATQRTLSQFDQVGWSMLEAFKGF